MASLTKDNYFAELLDIKEKISDFLVLIQNGKINYFKELSAKLRIFYCDKSGKSSFLKILQKNFLFEAFVLTSDLMDEFNKMSNLQFSLNNNAISWFDFGNKFIPVLESINQNNIFYSGNYHSYKIIIEVMSEKMGGVHIDSKIKDEDLVLHCPSFLIGNLPTAKRALYDLAKGTLKLMEYIIDYIKLDKESDFIRKKL